MDEIELYQLLARACERAQPSQDEADGFPEGSQVPVPVLKILEREPAPPILGCQFPITVLRSDLCIYVMTDLVVQSIS